MGNFRNRTVWSRSASLARLFVACALGAALATTNAASAQTCKSYVGQTVTPLSFQQAVGKVPYLTPKGEFETTDQYEARKNAVGNVGPLVIWKPLASPNFLEYDADKGKLSIYSGAFGGYGFDPRRAAVYSPEFRAFKPAGGMTYHLRVSPEDLTKLDVIYEHVAGATDFDRFELFPTQQGTSLLGTIALSPAEAQRVKPTLKLALVVVPQAPFVVRATYPLDQSKYGPTTLQVKATLLVADFRCGLVLTPSGKALAAFPTR